MPGPYPGRPEEPVTARTQGVVPPSGGAPPVARKRSWWIRLRWPVMVVGLLLIGGSLTYLFVPPMVVSERAITVDPADLIAAQAQDAQPMPSLLGINRDVAQSVLGDNGLSGVKTTFVEQPAAGPVGLVLAQKPSPGAQNVKDIELTVSSPAQMPAVTGSTVADGRKTLEQLGAVVEIERRLDPNVPRGQIVESFPPAGDVMPVVVRIAVADPGDALSLASVNDVDSRSCSSVSGTITVNGKSVSDGIECDTGKNVAFVEYSLARNAAALEALVGTNDRGGTGGAKVTIFGDGRVLAVVDVGLGNSQPVRVDLRGVLRLRIEAVTGDVDNAPSAVLADARLLGPKDGLDVIASGR